MKIANRKLSSLLPSRFQPLARHLGREGHRATLAGREALLRAHLTAGRGITHIHGPEQIELGPTDLVVLCLVRNGVVHLPTFIPYYQHLGAKHLVFLDNGSSDETVDMIRSYPCVSIFQTELSFARYEVNFKRWLVNRFGKNGGWSLVADVDELFDYPFAPRVGLSSFLGYLNNRGYDAVCAQNLEMVCPEPLAAIQGRIDSNLEDTHTYYDLSDIRKTRDPFWIAHNTIDSDGHFSHTGGIRGSFFGYDNDKLTKLPLVRYSDRINVFPYDVHFMTGARIADVTTVFRHYKFTGAFFQHVKEEVERGEHYRNAEVFHRYQKVLSEHPDLCLLRPTSRPYKGAAELLESGFLIASDDYRDWVRKHGAETNVQVSA